MLRGIPSIISPELLKVLHEMGHGDCIVIGDCNFPATSIARAKQHINIRCDGHRATELLDAILKLMPLDDFVEKPVTLMKKVEKDRDMKTPIWDEFKEIIERHDERGASAVDYAERFDFYEKAKNAYAVVSTTEMAFYACIIIQKGCLIGEGDC